jgi:hypothetical protein
VRVKADGDGTSGDPHGEDVAEPPDHVVPPIRHTGERQVGQVRSPVVKETSEESLIDLDLGAWLSPHPESVPRANPNSRRGCLD